MRMMNPESGICFAEVGEEGFGCLAAGGSCACLGCCCGRSSVGSRASPIWLQRGLSLPSGLCLPKSGLVHEGVSQALVVAVLFRCKHQQLFWRCDTLQWWSGGVFKHSVPTKNAPRIVGFSIGSMSVPSLTKGAATDSIFHVPTYLRRHLAWSHGHHGSLIAFSQSMAARSWGGGGSGWSMLVENSAGLEVKMMLMLMRMD